MGMWACAAAITRQKRKAFCQKGWLQLSSNMMSPSHAGAIRLAFRKVSLTPLPCYAEELAKRERCSSSEGIEEVHMLTALSASDQCDLKKEINFSTA